MIYNETLEQGAKGGIVISDTNAATGTWGGFLAGPGGCTVSSITSENLTDASGLQAAWAEGLYVPGKFTGVTLSAGVLIAYNRYNS